MVVSTRSVNAVLTAAGFRRSTSHTDRVGRGCTSEGFSTAYEGRMEYSGGEFRPYSAEDAARTGRDGWYTRREQRFVRSGRVVVESHMRTAGFGTSRPSLDAMADALRQAGFTVERADYVQLRDEDATNCLVVTSA